MSSRLTNIPRLRVLYKPIFIFKLSIVKYLPLTLEPSDTSLLNISPFFSSGSSFWTLGSCKHLSPFSRIAPSTRRWSLLPLFSPLLCRSIFGSMFFQSSISVTGYQRHETSPVIFSSRLFVVTLNRCSLTTTLIKAPHHLDIQSDVTQLLTLTPLPLSFTFVEKGLQTDTFPSHSSTNVQYPLLSRTKSRLPLLRLSSLPFYPLCPLPPLLTPNFRDSTTLLYLERLTSGPTFTIRTNPPQYSPFRLSYLHHSLTRLNQHPSTTDHRKRDTLTHSPYTVPTPKHLLSSRVSR